MSQGSFISSQFKFQALLSNSNNIDDDSSKQELPDSGSERGSLSLSLPPSLSLQGDMGMGGPHSLLAMCASAETQTPSTIFGTEEEPTKKKYEVNFQTTEDKLVAVYSSRDEDA